MYTHDEAEDTSGWLFVYAVAMAAFSPIVYRDLWNWFMVPAFGLPLLTYRLVFGISLLRSLMTYKYTGKPTLWKEMNFAVVMLLCCWGVGALLR